MTQVLPGKPYPLGATWDGVGVNFALYSETATKVQLCLFDAGSKQQTECLDIHEIEGYVWHCYLPEARPGLLYGYRVHGPYQPEEGLRFNPAKLLIDPYARAISGAVDWQAPVFGYRLGNHDADLCPDEQDDAWGKPKGVVINPYFPWEDIPPPRIPWHRTVIYETHVRGLTIQHPDIAPEHRGTYAGLASPPMLEYLQRLGITTVELMPVQDMLEDKHLIDRGLRNYWGYNTTNFFSPAARYSSSGDMGEQVTEFKAMVKALHRVGIEVILDVVFNHTSEGNHLGPTLSFRGIDNPTYYKLSPENRRYYDDYTRTGNSLNVRHPQVIKLIMDSLRYWVTDMRVDGFRFDLASALARELFDVDMLSPFFDVIYQDPVLSYVKLIAEPWDVGSGGYQVGKFPVLWTECNAEYRDTMRRFWKGDDGAISHFGYRLSGSSDIYEGTGRGPYASINFITSHDGFTLNDLVSYNEKHNEANGEDNRDGMDNNFSWNCGAEGPTDDPGIKELRERQQRNFMVTLLLSQGVPMLLGGDEISHTKGGNNNSYCQDNEINWYNWSLDERQQAFLNFTRYLIKMRASHPVLRRRKYFQGRPIRGAGIKDIIWLRCDGQEMNDEDWKSSWVRCLGLLLSGEASTEINLRGEPVYDDNLLIMMNSHHEPIRFLLPDRSGELPWEILVDTRVPTVPPGWPELSGGQAYEVEGRSIVVMKQARQRPTSPTQAPFV